MSKTAESDNYSSDEQKCSNSETDTEKQRSEIRDKLGTLSFEELLKMKEKMGSKLYNQMLFGNKNVKQAIKLKRANKNRPQELSSKIKPKFLQKTISTSKSKMKTVQYRDPRFDVLCGEFDKHKFNDDYKFIYDIQKQEKQILEQEEKVEKDIEKKKKLKSAIQRLVSNGIKCLCENVIFSKLQNNKSLEQKRSNDKDKKKNKSKEIKEKLKKGEVLFQKNKGMLNYKNMTDKFL